MTASSTLIAASVSEAGVPLTTFEVTFPGCYLAEVLSNREVSITVAGGLVQRALNGGMVKAVLTATDWSRFLAKYRGGDRSLALATLVRAMQVQLAAVTPAIKRADGWHLPYIDKATVEDACLLALEAGGLTAAQLDAAATSICVKASVHRCHHASRSMLPLLEQIAGYDALLHGGAVPSAFEHQAQPDVLVDGFTPGASVWGTPSMHGNLPGWLQHARGFFVPPPIPVTPYHHQEYAAHG